MLTEPSSSKILVGERDLSNCGGFLLIFFIVLNFLQLWEVLNFPQLPFFVLLWLRSGGGVGGELWASSSIVSFPSATKAKSLFEAMSSFLRGEFGDSD